MTSRRDFLRVLGASAGAGFASNLASFNAYAANTSDYRALVCVFLPGGQDGHDVLIPFDVSSNRLFNNVRSPLLDQYIAEGHASRYRGNLLRLQSNRSNGTVADGREFALPREMAELHSLYTSGNLAAIGNVGPLIEPTNRATYLNGSARLPPRLFSHNDQQSIWMASNPEGASAGWGGRFGDIMQAANANQRADFTTVSSNGNQIFTTGETVSGYHLSDSGGTALDGINRSNSQPWREQYHDVLRGLDIRHSNLFARDLVGQSLTGLNNSALVRELFSLTTEPTTAFPNTGLGRQLKAVAMMIQNRDRLGMSRQIFFVQHRASYDTHANQAVGLPLQQAEVSQAISAFYQESIAMGIADQVTTFTASDFGRTLTLNGSGTDHGWGGHHIAVGGGVNGGQILGNVPEAELGHGQDLGRGRLIPEVSVDQFAVSLARWFGLSESEALEVLPNARNHDFRELYGMFSGDFMG